MVLRIPTEDFDDAMAELEKVGTLVTSKSETADVTTQVLDIDVRVEAQQRSIDRIQVLFDNATTIKDVVSIEGELSRRQADLASLQAQQRYLADQTSMSTITLAVERTPKDAKPKADDDDTGFMAGLTGGWDALRAFLVGVATVAGALLPWLVARAGAGDPRVAAGPPAAPPRRRPASAVAPPPSSQGVPNPENIRLAVLIDADNTSPKHAEALLEEVAKYGVPTVRRAYGDWTDSHLSGWMKKVRGLALQPMLQVAHTSGKNSTDSALIIDAMDLLYSDNVDAFALVSSDSDFTSLATRLRASGKTVYGLGLRKTPESLRRAVDRFIFLEDLDDADDRRGTR